MGFNSAFKGLTARPLGSAPLRLDGLKSSLHCSSDRSKRSKTVSLCGTSAPELSFATQMSLRVTWEKDGELLFKDEKTAPTMH